jgi:WD40 repeat protein
LHKELFSGSQDCLIKAWDAQTGQLLRKQSGHGGWITDLLFVPELRLLFSCSIDHTIRVWSDKGKQAQVPAQTLYIHQLKVLRETVSTLSGLAAAPQPRP